MSENNEILSVGQAAKYLGITVHTLQDWDRKNKFKAHRNPVNTEGGHRDRHRELRDGVPHRFR